MRVYNIFLCPKCGHFEFRSGQALAGEKKVPAKLNCHASKKSEEITFDTGHGDVLTNPPPTCADFDLDAKKRAK